MIEEKIMKEMLYVAKVMGVASLVIELDEQKIVDIISRGAFGASPGDEINNKVVATLKLMAFMIGQLKPVVPPIGVVQEAGKELLSKFNNSGELDDKIREFMKDIRELI